MPWRPANMNLNESYYAVIREIPRGLVMTYRDVAAYTGDPHRARCMGNALAALKAGDLPWWRVINADGAISSRSLDGAPEKMQQDFLEEEGVEFTLVGSKWRVNLDRFRYRPDPPPS